MIEETTPKQVLPIFTQSRVTPERKREYDRSFREKHRDSIRQYGRTYYRVHTVRIKAAARAKLAKDKKTVLTHYGHGRLQCTWPDCCVIDVDMLTLDHINNDGSGDRRHSRKSGGVSYPRILRDGFPTGFQTLCWNHQWKKELQRRRFT